MGQTRRAKTQELKISSDDTRGINLFKPPRPGAETMAAACRAAGETGFKPVRSVRGWSSGSREKGGGGGLGDECRAGVDEPVLPVRVVPDRGVSGTTEADRPVDKANFGSSRRQAAEAERVDGAGRPAAIWPLGCLAVLSLTSGRTMGRDGRCGRVHAHARHR